jgi:ATP-dependent RNA helicase DDX24/MAK5
LSKRNVKGSASVNANKGSRFVVIGQDQIEPLQALQNSGQEVCANEIFLQDYLFLFRASIIFGIYGMVYFGVAYLFSDFVFFQVCVSIDKQREKRRLAENWRRKKQKEKKSKLSSTPLL